MAALLYIIFCIFVVLTIHTSYGLRSFLQMSSRVRKGNDGATSSAATLAPNPVAANKPIVIKAEKLSKTYTEIPQFSDISLQILQHQCVGVIGPNGAGKSTLVKCLAGKETLDSGTVEISKNARNLVYVEQEVDVNEMLFGYHLVFPSESKVMTTLREYCAIEHATLKGSEVNMDGDVIDKMTNEDGWGMFQEAVTLMEEVGLNADYLYQSSAGFSGGERKKLSLIAAMLQKPDVLLLDEPTNHLDIDALEWLAKTLQSAIKAETMTVVMVTHDRSFLERVCNEIIELEYAALNRYPGNYGRYLELKADRLAAEDAETDRVRTKLRRETEWMRKQPRARQSKSRYRQDQYFELVEKSTGREQTGSMDLSEKAGKGARLGSLVAEFRHAAYSLPTGRVLLKDFTYNMDKSDRIGIVGPNGVGKSTFLQLLSQQLALTSGSVRLGDTTRIGYYSQSGLNISAEESEMNVLKYVQSAMSQAADDNDDDDNSNSGNSMPRMVVATEQQGRRDRNSGKEAKLIIKEVSSNNNGGQALTENEARKWLNMLQFPTKKWATRVGMLSGGERRRLQLLQVLARKPNVLLLDEPTNDLDLKTLTALEEYLLETYEGSLVIISHDQFFLDRIASKLFVLTGDGEVRGFQGTYNEYLDFRKEFAAMAKQSPSTSSSNDIPSTIQSSASNGKVLAKASMDVISADSKSSSIDIIDPITTIKGESKKPHQTSKQQALSNDERKEFNRLEKQIEKLNDQIKSLEKKMEEASLKNEGYSVLGDLSKKIETARSEQQEKESRWMQLAERA